MVLGKNNKKIGVFIFFDRDGIVDDYVTYLLDDLVNSLDDLIIISNSYLDCDNKNKLLKYTDKIDVRNNVGLDAGAFKYAYDKYKNYFNEFDELTIINDTFFGPFIPFKKIYSEMDVKDLDFWGLTANYDSVDGYGVLPDNMIHSHIQTFFISFRKSVLKSKEFNDYWEKYDVNNMLDFIDVVTKHELYITNYLEKSGFKWDTYVDLTKYKSNELEGNFNIYGYCSYDLIKYYNCPFIKRKNFIFNKNDSMYLNDGCDSRRVIEYLKDNKIYDTDLIYKNITRLYNSNDLYYGLNMSYVIKESKIDHKKDYAIVLYIEDEKFADEYLKRFNELKIDNIFINTDNKNIIKQFKGYNVNANIKEIKEYSYLFVINDFEEINVKIIAPYLDLIQEIFENGINSKEYINGVIEFFQKNEYISLLLLPECLHSNYFSDVLNTNKVLQYIKNACWIKSEYFENISNNDYIFINNLIDKICIDHKLFAKIYSEFSSSNRLLIQENVINQTYKRFKNISRTTRRSFPEILAFNFNDGGKNNIVKRAYRKLKKITKK